MSITLNFLLGSRVIAGSLGGKSLYCTLRPSRGGTLPPAGEYEISPSVSDPIYGRLALMTPSESSPAASPTGIRKSGELKDKWDDWLASAFGSLNATIKFWRPGDGPVYVISGQAIPGRSTIIVTAGLSDLMDGLQAEGGARVTLA